MQRRAGWWHIALLQWHDGILRCCGTAAVCGSAQRGGACAFVAVQLHAVRSVAAHSAIAILPVQLHAAVRVNATGCLELHETLLCAITCSYKQSL